MSECSTLNEGRSDILLIGLKAWVIKLLLISEQLLLNLYFYLIYFGE